jgi:Domain of unknown function (DUF1844)
MSDDREERGGIRVTDRRRFSDTGEPREDAGEPAAEATDADASRPGDAAPADAPAAPVSFSTFVLGLSTQALMHLGEVEHPVTGTTERDLPAAQHVIDVLGVLSAKTAGNLDSAEQALMESVLYDLRMRYVDLVRGGSDPENTKEKA